MRTRAKCTQRAWQWLAMAPNNDKTRNDGISKCGEPIELQQNRVGWKKIVSTAHFDGGGRAVVVRRKDAPYMLGRSTSSHLQTPLKSVHIAKLFNSLALSCIMCPFADFYQKVFRNNRKVASFFGTVFGHHGNIWPTFGLTEANSTHILMGQNTIQYIQMSLCNNKKAILQKTKYNSRET